MALMIIGYLLFAVALGALGGVFSGHLKVERK